MSRKEENWKLVTRLSFDGGKTYHRLDEMPEEKRLEAREQIWKKVDMAMSGIGYERVRKEA